MMLCCYSQWCGDVFFLVPFMVDHLAFVVVYPTIPHGKKNIKRICLIMIDKNSCLELLWFIRFSFVFFSLSFSAVVISYQRSFIHTNTHIHRENELFTGSQFENFRSSIHRFFLFCFVSFIPSRVSSLFIDSFIVFVFSRLVLTNATNRVMNASIGYTAL